MKPLHVAIATDRGYLGHAAAMLDSLSLARGAQTVVHLLHGPELDVGLLGAMARFLEARHFALVTHRIAPEEINGLPRWGRIPTTMWYRVLLPERLPDVDRVLYLDVDVLVGESLDELVDLDLTGFCVGAVTNVPEQHRMDHAVDLGLSGPQSYFNSGVLLMNLELMREEETSRTLLSCARLRRESLLWPDQDVLNLVLSNRRLPLHPRYNLMNSIRRFPWAEQLFEPGEVAEACIAPAIVHFEGPAENKPWHLLARDPYRSIYREHRRRTPWPRYLPSGLGPRNLLAFGWQRLTL